jgi:molybdate transport system regulatory protein
MSSITPGKGRRYTQNDFNLATEFAMNSRKERQITLRVYLTPDIYLGPGKADVLRGIDETGSISATGRLTGMSYKRTWQLVDRMNQDFLQPVVQTSTGGQRGGGASLTTEGKKVLKLYDNMMSAALKGISRDLAQLKKMISAVK